MSQAQYNAIFSNLFKKSTQDQNQLPANLQKFNMSKVNLNDASTANENVAKKFKPNLTAYKKDNDAKPYESSMSFCSTTSSAPSWASVQQPNINDQNKRLQSQTPSEDAPLSKATSLRSDGNKLFKLNIIYSPMQQHLILLLPTDLLISD